MKKILLTIAALALSLLVAACHGSADFGLDEQNQPSHEAEEVAGWADPEPLDHHALPELDHCGCGDLIDEDQNGVCDLAESGQCRRGTMDRCPCGMGCPGGC